ncbi:MAG: TetR/AcrR family transcriptional regulator [Flavobacterium piscis]|jgi:TetR/AcrR family transcriptional repressor of nem operon|uniref:TetR/AcrR family transcriptional regulator n=1 Tax=Flavobacterium sp. KBS0721 TaxID=1179672 RepID=UPI00098F17D0|nr:TetR/AcrR family transcriptional regulator [Flavobacterium sp. KBS0721]MCA1920112.1 TetR/AcrR family transcriptional regulator [Flavobacterium piscis]QDW21611.1 TetR/AcrR family transcriptional regulator [Flavobacterium sp. KBS0721]
MLTKAERTKQFILETAVPLYNEKGISGVNIDDVLEATKLTKGCLYGHFENKEDLSEQVIDLSLKLVSDRIRAAVYQAKTIKGKVFAFLDFYKNPIETYISGGCPIFNTAVEADDNYPLIKEKVAKVFRSGQQELAGLLQEGINTGEFSAKLDPVVFAFKLTASVEGGIVMCRVMGTAKPMQGLVKSLKSELEQYVI